MNKTRNNLNSKMLMFMKSKLLKKLYIASREIAKRSGIPVSILTIIAITAGCNRGPNLPPQMTPEVSTVVITQQTVVLTTELPGRTAPYLIAEVRPQVSGLIQKRLFVEGSDVKAGDVLYQIDPAPFQAALDNALAGLGRAEANLPAIRARAERFKQLLADKAVSQQSYDEAESALKEAEAEIKYWQAMVETARINLGYTKITAPISGRIGKSSVTDGAIVTAYQPVALATIQQLDPIYVDVPQSTTDLLRLKKRIEAGLISHSGAKQNTVKLILEDGTIYPLEGTLQFQDVSVDPSMGSVILRMVFPNPDAVLLPGMFVRAIVMEGVNEKAILISQQAVSRDYKGNPIAYVVDEKGIVQQKLLTLDRAISNNWLVTSGLNVGDKVVMEGIQRIRPGVPVREVPYQGVGGSNSLAGGMPQGLLKN
jgi:membrane fusion protein (multidrug efflux system)